MFNRKLKQKIKRLEEENKVLKKKNEKLQAEKIEEELKDVPEFPERASCYLCEKNGFLKNFKIFKSRHWLSRNWIKICICKDCLKK